MKKTFFLLAALFSVAPMFAQSDDGEGGFTIETRGKSNAFFLGPKFGGTLNTMTQPNEGDLYKSSSIGFSGGLAMKARFGRASENSVGGTGLIGVGIELKYRQSTVKTNAINQDGKEEANLSVGYFEVPVYLQIYPFVKSRAMNTFYVELGASFAGTMSRSPQTLTLMNPNANLSSVTYNVKTDGSKLKGMDFRPLVGLGYTIPNTGLDLNARYYWGTSSLAENFPCKMNSFEFSVAWLFSIGRF